MGRPLGKTLLNSGSCIIETCSKEAVRRGYCHAHYSRWRRHGDPLVTKRAVSTIGVTPEYKDRWVEEYKLDKGCADCGYKGHPVALQFDHRPGTVKIRDIKSGQHLGWAALMVEIEKCDVVCANCHAIRTFERQRSLTVEGR
jgi:hypothetical protein